MNDIAGIGHNQASPFDLSLEEIEGLFEEAKHWLDGRGVNSQADADGVGKLLDAARQAKKIADEARKVEKAPHDNAGKAVQEKWKPILDKADLVADTCKATLKPYLERLELEKQAIAEKARREAKEKMEIAAAAIRKAHEDEGNLAERETAEIMLKSAQRSEAAAARAEKDTARAAGGARSIGLRTYYRAEVTDYPTFVRHTWNNYRDDIVLFLDDFAQKLIDNGAKELPGTVIHADKRAV